MEPITFNMPLFPSDPALRCPGTSDAPHLTCFRHMSGDVKQADQQACT